MNANHKSGLEAVFKSAKEQSGENTEKKLRELWLKDSEERKGFFTDQMKNSE